MVNFYGPESKSISIMDFLSISLGDDEDDERNGTEFPIQFVPFNITISLKYTYNKEINIHII